MEELKSEIVEDEEKEFRNEPVAQQMHQNDDAQIRDLKSELQFKLQVLDAKIEQVRAQEDCIKSIKRQLEELTDRG